MGWIEREREEGERGGEREDCRFVVCLFGWLFNVLVN